MRHLHRSRACTLKAKLTAIKKSVLTTVSHIYKSQTSSPFADFSAVLKSPYEASGSFDFIICAHKAINPSSIPSIFQSVATALTTFVIIQNGVGNEDPFRATFPTSPIISCVTWVGAVQNSPGVITHNGTEDMQIGLFPNPEPTHDGDRLSLFATLLTTGGTIFQISPNVQKERWEKVVWNAAWNPLTTLTAVPCQTWLASSEEALDVTKQLMREVIDVGRKCGVPLEYELVDQLIAKVLALPTLIFSSMYVDSKAGRALEVDVILGTPMKRARELGLYVPVLKTIYGLTMAVNQRLVSH